MHPQAHGACQLCACANIGVTVDGKVVVGRRLHHRAGVHRREASPTRQEQPSLASVGGGMWPLAFVHPRAADARVRPPILLTHM